MSFRLLKSADLIELERQGALAAGSRVLVQNSLGHSLIDFLHGDLITPHRPRCDCLLRQQPRTS